jgi:tetratricopeptide (TPR) repeat protein
MLPETTLARLALDFEVGFYEAALGTQPDDLRTLEALAGAYARVGRLDESLRVDRRIVDLVPANPAAHYNLGCSLSLAGDLDAAFAALERALALGYRDFAHMAKDPDLAAVRADPRYRSLRAAAPGASGGAATAPAATP